MAKRKDIMLAYPAEEKRIKALGKDYILQPKLAGIRAWVKWSPETGSQLISSQGNEFLQLQHINHALNQLANLTEAKPAFDGELYSHGMPFQEISSRVKRKVAPHPDAESIQFHIFDQKTDQPQIERLRDLYPLFGPASVADCLQIVPNSFIRVGSYLGYLALQMTQGYEGIIFRAKHGFYQEKRSTSLLKLKPTSSDLYEIVGLQQGKGWCYDRLGAFLVKGSDGTVFSVGSGETLTAEKRLTYWKQGQELIGKELLVKHERIKTKDGVPFCAVACKVVEV